MPGGGGWNGKAVPDTPPVPLLYGFGCLWAARLYLPAARSVLSRVRADSDREAKGVMPNAL